MEKTYPLAFPLKSGLGKQADQFAAYRNCPKTDCLPLDRLKDLPYRRLHEIGDIHGNLRLPVREDTNGFYTGETSV